jgi:uncharacterized membrane protein
MVRMNIFSILNLYDWLALLWFALAWAIYAGYARRVNATDTSLLQVTNRYRREWLMQTTARDPRMIDAVITQTLSQTPTFFCSTTILVIGGLLAVLGTSDKAAELARDIPFVARTTALVFDIKLITLVAVFVYAFFRFSWSMRQYTFVALVIGAMPPPRTFTSEEHERKAYAAKAAGLVALAAESFNDGLRAYYFAFAVVGWFVSPLVFCIGTAAVVGILYRREFKSDVLKVLQTD